MCDAEPNRPVLSTASCNLCEYTASLSPRNHPDVTVLLALVCRAPVGVGVGSDVAAAD